MLLESLGEGLALLGDGMTHLEASQDLLEHQEILTQMRSVFRTITSLHPSLADVSDWSNGSAWVSPFSQEPTEVSL